MHTPDQTHKERLYLDINLQLMQKNLPEIKWLIVLLVKEIKKYFKSEKEEIEQSEVTGGEFMNMMFDLFDLIFPVMF